MLMTENNNLEKEYEILEKAKGQLKKRKNIPTMAQVMLGGIIDLNLQKKKKKNLNKKSCNMMKRLLI